MITSTTPFFKSFVPTGVPNAITDVRQMIAYSIQAPGTPVVINYFSGAQEQYEFEISVQNITQNATLRVTASTGTGFVVTPNQIVLQPRQIEKIQVQLNNTELNNIVLDTSIQTSITLTVQNDAVGTVVLKDISLPALEPQTLPLTIEVV